MKYQEYLPHSSLQDYVKCFWILEKEYTLEDPNEEVTPDACTELIFNDHRRCTVRRGSLGHSIAAQRPRPFY